MITRNTTIELYTQYRTHLQMIADIKYAVAVLQWDQETYMPAKSAGFRAQQIATLTQLAHNYFTAEKTGNLLIELNARGDLSENERKNVELSLYDFNKQKKLSTEFVRRLSQATSQSFEACLEARRSNSFGLFEKDLTNMISLKREEADQLGFEHHPYDALLNEYERGCTVSLLDKTFNSLLPPLKMLLSKIEGREQVDDAFLHQHFPTRQQWEFGMELLKEMGFDFERGRQDISEHPFTTNFNSTDVRITTRIDENNFGSMTWSCIHELGHALYEQGLPQEEYGLPLGEYASLSIHESQSRLWENNVGRSLAFWNHHLTSLKKHFPEQLAGIDLWSFYKGINKVRPSLVRTEADELTYHFHVMIRYELEKKLIEGSLSANDIPVFWKERYSTFLGVDVPDDKSGSLQDVHWSHGSFGYFPTYSLGSLYAAQFYSTLKTKVHSLEEEISRGNTRTLREWLRTNVNRYGRKLTSEQLCEQITGKGLDISFFLEYATQKYRDIYKFE